LAECFGSPVREHSSGSKTQRENFTYETHYLISALIALRS